jgi:hypothetical protein
MAVWPNISASDYGLDEEYYKPQIRTEFEGNYVQSRAKSTRARNRWALHWLYMTEAEFQTLKTFFNTNQGLSFTWVHPVTSVSYSCFFSVDSLKSKININGYREVDVMIEES